MNTGRRSAEWPSKATAAAAAAAAQRTRQSQSGRRLRTNEQQVNETYASNSVCVKKREVIYLRARDKKLEESRSNLREINLCLSKGNVPACVPVSVHLLAERCQADEAEAEAEADADADEER